MKASEILGPEQGAELERILDDVNGLERVVMAMPAVTAENEKQAAALLTRGRARLAELDGMRKELKAPVLESGRRIDAFFAETTGPIKLVVDHVGKLISEYRTREHERAERARREEQARIDEMRRQEIERQRELARQIDAEPEELVPAVRVAAVTPEAVTTSAGTMHDRRDLVVTIEDAGKLPREYLVPDQRAVEKAAKAIDAELMAAGEPFETVALVISKAIPGVTVQQIWTPVSRRARREDG